MNNNAETTDSESGSASNLTPKDVGEFLRANPDFFVRHNELLAELHVIQEKQGIVSLTQLQLDQYRDKVKSQKKQLESFIHNAKVNESLYYAYADLNLAISTCQSMESLQQALEQHLCHQLGMLATNLVVITPRDDDLPDLSTQSLLHKKLAKKEFYLGRLSKHEKNALFDDIDIGSVALIKIDCEPMIAVLSIASSDDSHFIPEMDTSLLDYLRRFLICHLERICATQAQLGKP
ncbi:MAG: DUF484 family protein [Pseudomonadota bacterium]